MTRNGVQGSGASFNIQALKLKGNQLVAGQLVTPDENPSGILPTAFKVLVIPDPVEQKTAGGIIIPDQIKEREKFASQKATLIAVSPAAFSYDDAVKANPPKPGDRVVIAKYAGFDIKGKDGAEYRVIEDKDVCAVLA